MRMNHLHHRLSAAVFAFFLVSFLGSPIPSHSAVSIITAASASQSAVQAAINSAKDGDTVIIPAGTVTWSGTVSMTKAINLIGAGIGQTIITNSSVGLLVTIAAPKKYTISGLEMRSSGGGGFTYMDAPFCIHTAGDCQLLRITACKFYNTGTEGGYLLGIGDLNDSTHQYGVIDHCVFVNGKILLLGGGMGDKSWKTETALGTEKALYVEDNSFDQPNGAFNNAIDCNYGARYVFRHNRVKDAFIMAHPLQNGDTSYFGRGTRKVEIYENAIEATSANPLHWVAISVAAGTGVVFNNTVTNTSGDPFNYLVGLDNLRTSESGSGKLTIADGGNIIDGNTAVSGGTGTHSGADGAAVLTCAGKSWGANAYVGNYVYNLTGGSKGKITANTATTVTATLSGGSRNSWNGGDSFKITNGYPTLDQIGRGPDATTAWVMLPPYNASYQPQASEPLYIWNNKMGGVVQTPAVLNGAGKHVQLNRDYYNSAKPGYTPYTYPHPLVAATTKKDLIASWNSQGVAYRNSDSGVWVNITTPAVCIAAGDLDRDGIDDLLGVWPGQNGVFVKYSAQGYWALLTSLTARQVSAGDMNGDGRIELVGTWDSQGVFYLDAAGNWVLIATPATQITTGDLDGDGIDDLIGVWPSQAGVWAKLSKTNTWLKLGSTPRDIAAGDMNGDGKKELLATWDGQGVFYRNSDGSWMSVAVPADQVTCGDLDGDGIDDLIGSWPDQGGLYAKFSKTGAWAYLGTTPTDIAMGKMHAVGATGNGAPAPLEQLGDGPGRAGNLIDLSMTGPGGPGFVYQTGLNLTPTGNGMSPARIPGPGEPGFQCAKQNNLWPRDPLRNIKTNR
jgi:hypothetical protein